MVVRKIHWNIWLVAYFMTMSWPALAALPVILIDQDLNEQPARLVGVAEGYLSYFDADRSLQQAPVTDFLAIRVSLETKPKSDTAGPNTTPSFDDLPPEARAWLDQAEDEQSTASAFSTMMATAYLADGQILHGRLAGLAVDGQPLRFEHTLAGPVEVTIDQMRLLKFRSPPPRDEGSVVLPDVTSDIVVFTNGDRMAGFVQGVSDKGIELLPDGSNDALNLPLETCQQIALGTGFQMPGESPYRLVFTDGTTLDCKQLSYARDQWTFVPILSAAPDQRQTASIHEIVEVQILAGDSVIVPIWQWPIDPTSSQVFGLAVPTQVTSKGIIIQAPLDWVWRLPTGSRLVQFQATVTNGPWADVVLQVDDGSQSPASYTLNTTQRAALVKQTLNRPRMRLQLKPAGNGPIQDRVQLRDAMVVVDR